MDLKPLEAAAFEATASESMNDVTHNPHAAVPIDIWPYADAALAQAFPEIDTSGWDVCQVFQNTPGTYQHVVIGASKRQDRLVVVLDLEAGAIHGHAALDLEPTGSRLF